MTRIDPDRHKAERRKTLPRTPCNTAGVLSPDLPAQFRKSSQRTIATHSTSGSTNSPSPPLRRRFVEELRLNGTPTTRRRRGGEGLFVLPDVLCVAIVR